jgi:hypothetical protein
VSWSFVGSVTTDVFSGVSSGTVHLPSGVNGGDAVVVMCCSAPTTAPQTVSLAGFTQQQSFGGGAKSGNFGDFFWGGTRAAGGSAGSATTDTTYAITFGSATWAEALTFVLRPSGASWSVVGSGKYNGNAPGTYSTACPNAVYSPASSANATIWAYAGQNSSVGGTGTTFSGTGPSALSNFVQASATANGGGVGAGWLQSTSAPGSATASQAVDATDFAIELSTVAGSLPDFLRIPGQAVSRASYY